MPNQIVFFLLNSEGSLAMLILYRCMPPTSEAEDDEIEKFYSDLIEMKFQCKSHEVNIIMGDFSARFGSEKM